MYNNISKKQSLCSRRRLNLIKRATKYELILKENLSKIGIRAIFQKGWIAGKNFVISDFYIPKFKTAIEVDGEYHNDAKQIDRDKNKDWYLKTRGIKTVRIKNEEVNNIDFLKFLFKE